MSGCSGKPAPEVPAAASEHNATDVMFLQMMITQNQQGLEMTALAADRAGREEVKLLAAAIDTTQRAEVGIMRSWLQGWNEVTAVAPDPGAHANHGGLPATGPEQIAALRDTADAGFETAFLSLLTGHQHAAVEMTQLVAAGGVNPETRDLAQRIKESRGEQIAQMLRLMNGESA
ncbi:DUF305 domain-containing protein [Phytohabitans rumicis]|uniref:DUF305 domain-containing protein n=1 Tax=Phytohabitans rumicis TaxID=1076125 RepID=UPI00353150B7